MVPLVGENRILAAFGLGGLKASKLTGIQALIESASLTGKRSILMMSASNSGPRLNAIGRLGHAKLAVEMLTDASADRARESRRFSNHKIANGKPLKKRFWNKRSRRRSN